VDKTKSQKFGRKVTSFCSAFLLDKIIELWGLICAVGGAIAGVVLFVAIFLDFSEDDWKGIIG
jgi:hypothetical protein